MDLKEIVSIAGIGGLHKVVGRRPNGLIVETLDESKKRFPTTATQKLSVLEDISIYTVEGEARLRDVIVSIKDKELAGSTVPGKKDSEEQIRSFMEQVLPNYDKERVYSSDLKKLFQWYGMLNPILDWDKVRAGDEANEGESVTDEKVETPKKTAKATKVAPTKTAAPKSANVKMKSNTPRKTGGA